MPRAPIVYLISIDLRFKEGVLRFPPEEEVGGSSPFSRATFPDSKQASPVWRLKQAYPHCLRVQM
jgi:hypothetical protein